MLDVAKDFCMSAICWNCIVDTSVNKTYMYSSEQMNITYMFERIWIHHTTTSVFGFPRDLLKVCMETACTKFANITFLQLDAKGHL